MKRILSAMSILLGSAFLALAVLYSVTPANRLPAYVPGHDAKLTKVHRKHGAGAFALSMALFGFPLALRLGPQLRVAADDRVRRALTRLRAAREWRPLSGDVMAATASAEAVHGRAAERRPEDSVEPAPALRLWTLDPAAREWLIKWSFRIGFTFVGLLTIYILLS